MSLSCHRSIGPSPNRLCGGSDVLLAARRKGGRSHSPARGLEELSRSPLPLTLLGSCSWYDPELQKTDARYIPPCRPGPAQRPRCVNTIEPAHAS
eukprot:scaffold9663_cov31-Tisochrysis_lutea.AAC.1